MPKHIHADLISEYARLSHITDKPWEYFQYRFADGHDWLDATFAIAFHHNTSFRLKPRTIKIGDIEVPEPVREALMDGADYYYPNISYGCFNCNYRTWSGSICDKDILSSGLIHLDRESAELHAKALISLTSK
ncbi:hypothetical protein AFK69_00670 [Xenorhabdus sp. GDc328]|uniref:hypothetical protein n=2 Tax=Xenorhabdus TaxID=626 RepID=UPI0006AA50AB|nr:hypothetical protein [Xenorhabdus sp. GDc328]KOP35152.1 hypothetical protein AFK69_00670 [Xenorhabdus sp. GDc328]